MRAGCSLLSCCLFKFLVTHRLVADSLIATSNYKPFKDKTLVVISLCALEIGSILSTFTVGNFTAQLDCPAHRQR